MDVPEENTPPMPCNLGIISDSVLVELYNHYCKRMELFLNNECVKHDDISNLTVREKYNYYTAITVEMVILEDIMFEMTKRRMNTETADLYLKLLN